MLLTMTDSNDQFTANHIIDYQDSGTWDCVECLGNSFQRVQVLASLNDTTADLRELKDELAIPRTSLQRNLSVLEQRGWIKRTAPGYTTTSRGRLLTNVFIEMLEKVHRIESLASFLDEVDLSTVIDINRWGEFIVTVPDPRQPHAPMIRLFDIFETTEHMRAFSPVVPGLLTKRYHQPREVTGEHEFIFSKNSLEEQQNMDTDKLSEKIEIEQTTRFDILIYDGEFPYGLFVCEDTVALAAYNSLSRIQALVESKSETTISWGERMYETYRRKSEHLRETDRPHLRRSTGETD